jgi:hypothetical protein
MFVRFLLSLMIDERSAAVVVSEGTKKILRFDLVLKGCIKVAPLIRSRTYRLRISKTLPRRAKLSA